MPDDKQERLQFGMFTRPDGRFGYFFADMWQLPNYVVGDMTRERAWELYRQLIAAYREGDLLSAEAIVKQMKREGNLDYYFRVRHHSR